MSLNMCPINFILMVTTTSSFYGLEEKRFSANEVSQGGGGMVIVSCVLSCAELSLGDVFITCVIQPPAERIRTKKSLKYMFGVLL